jgi:hypothetical protein
MTDSTARQVPNLRPLAGPRVTGLEGDIPLYHVDIDKKDLDRLLADPVEFFKQMGVGPKQGIAPNGIMNVVLGDRGPSAGKLAKTTWCAYVVGDTTVVHAH